MSGGSLAKPVTCEGTWYVLGNAARKLLWEERHPGELYQPPSPEDAADTILEVLAR